MDDNVLGINDIAPYMMEHLKYFKTPVEKKDFIKQFVILLIRRKQRFSESVSNFETIFKLELPNHIRQILFDEKELFDTGKTYNSEALEQLSIYLLKFSPICEDELIYTKRMTDSREIVLDIAESYMK